MDRPVRVGLAGIADPRLLGDLRALPSRPELHSFPSLYDEIGRILAVQPDVLFVGGEGDGRDLGGALRLLHGLQPRLPVVVVAAAGSEVALGPVCERTGARLLLLPLTPGALANALEQALQGSNRPGQDVFLDLARGFADEINNPLLFLMGHLQLLKAQRDPAAEGDLQAQLGAALEGSQRIHAAVDRIRQLSVAANGPRQYQTVDLLLALQQAKAAPGLPDLPVICEPADARFLLLGDPDLLQPALKLLVQVAAELHELGCKEHFELVHLGTTVRLRLSLQGPGLDEWRLPRTYEPYYLNRVLRGSSQGLSLFFVQTAVHGHGGQATARRLPDGSLA